MKYKLDRLYQYFKTIFAHMIWRFRNELITIARRLVFKYRFLQIIQKDVRFIRSHLNSQVENTNSIHFRRNDDALLKKKEKFTDRKMDSLVSFLKSEYRISFKYYRQPRVSIVLVLFNRAELTLSCLQSILENCSVDIEIIIVDNSSSDATSAVLDRIDGATIILNNENVHFIKACNQARRYIRGEYILFLNNDSELLKNSLESALETIHQDDNIGAVGGRIVLLDGLLQEAGSIIWNDGSCLGYGRGDDPDNFQYRQQRDVDYCSGAFLLTPTRIFNELDGFDEDFSPAYYEETDYCMRLHRAGYRVVYEPNATIRHYEFASSSSSELAIDLQRKNRAKFIEKHMKILRKHFPPHSKYILRARFTASNQCKSILFVDDRIPYRYYGSGFPRANFIVHRLAELGFHVTLLPLNCLEEDDWEVVYSDLPKSIEIALGIGKTYFVRHLLKRKGYYDIIWISRPHNMDFFSKVIKKFPSLLKRESIIYDAEAIFALRDLELSKLKGLSPDTKDAERKIKHEVSLASNADIVIAVSDFEKLLFNQNGYKNTYVLGHALDVLRTEASFSDRKNFLFVGNLDYDRSPNVDSLIWFVKEVWPLIENNIKDIKLDIVGSANSILVQELASPDVIIHGRVDELDRWYNGSRVFIAPTRYAAGVPYKIHESAAHGVPVVATDLLVRQLDWQPGQEILCAHYDNAKAFAEKCIELYQSEHMWQAIRNRAITRVRQDCSSEMMRQNLKNIMEML